MLISDQPVGGDKVLITTPRAKETLPSEGHTLQTGNVAVEIARVDSKTMITVIIVVAIAVVIVIFTIAIVCLLLWSCLRERKRRVNSS